MRKLVCIYTDSTQSDNLRKLKETELYVYLENEWNTQIVEVYAGCDSISEDPGRVCLPTIESYDKLSQKTYEMMRYCVDSYEFDYLIKLDVTLTYELIDGLHWRNYFTPDAVTEFLKRQTYHEYDGIYFQEITQKAFNAWAADKSLDVNFQAEFGFEHRYPDCYCGKCYCVSRPLAEHIAETGKILADQYTINLGGCEDMFVGKCYQKYCKS